MHFVINFLAVVGAICFALTPAVVIFFALDERRYRRAKALREQASFVSEPFTELELLSNMDAEDLDAMFRAPEVNPDKADSHKDPDGFMNTLLGRVDRDVR